MITNEITKFSGFFHHVSANKTTQRFSRLKIPTIVKCLYLRNLHLCRCIVDDEVEKFHKLLLLNIIDIFKL